LTATPEGKFVITGVLMYPVPVKKDGNFSLKLDCTHAIVSVRMKIYTDAFRLIRDISWQLPEISGNYTVVSPSGCLEKYGSGTYI